MGLEVRNLKKSYDEFSISLDLSVGAGETLALVGPSGSGKTTALNLIAGLAEPETGNVIMDGEDITSLPSWKRNISVVFQDLALFPHLDVGGNIAYGLFIRGVPKKERRRIIVEMLDIVRLPGYASRRIDTLSGGERQRVAIARALASSPRALLLDEPFSSLDLPLRRALRREFLEIRNTINLHASFLPNSKAPCIFVTHDQEEAVMLGDRIALMKEGCVIETGSGRDLFLAPRTETAARFFGAGQVLPCRILGKREESVEVSSPLGILTVSNNFDINSHDNKHAEDKLSPPMLFIPQDAISFETADSTGNKSFSARCSGSLFDGQSLLLTLLLDRWEHGQGTGEKPISLELSVNPRMKPPVPGSMVKLWVDQSLVRFVK